MFDPSDLLALVLPTPTVEASDEAAYLRALESGGMTTDGADDE